jgi:hypothetical protein
MTSKQGDRVYLDGCELKIGREGKASTYSAVFKKKKSITFLIHQNERGDYPGYFIN